MRNALTAARKFAKGAITKEQLFRTHVNVCDLYNKLPYPSIERYVAAILISATRYPQEFGHNCFAAFNCLLLAEQETLNASLKQTNELRYEIAKTCLKQTIAVLKKEGKLRTFTPISLKQSSKTSAKKPSSAAKGTSSRESPPVKQPK